MRRTERPYRRSFCRDEIPRHCATQTSPSSPPPVNSTFAFSGNRWYPWSLAVRVPIAISIVQKAGRDLLKLNWLLLAGGISKAVLRLGEENCRFQCPHQHASRLLLEVDFIDINVYTGPKLVALSVLPK
ncbi:hypothetical protein MUK42_37406 [Musa troglodytarum]|uniref:Uncharacterized protein n=1 Tax=Musa troglodytarum TaxID=320322 RepID=A0A9E7KMB2_9LILI|nr:hypothetical protein MUK42_37406 [Musa troglodytarum]